MAGDLCDTFVAIRYRSSSVSRSYNCIDIFSVQTGLSECFFQCTLRTICSPCSCWHDHTGDNLSLSVQYHNICAGRTAVNSCKISLTHGVLLSRFCLYIQALCEGLQTCAQLSAALYGIIRFDLEERHIRMTLDIRIFKAVKITELYGMIDDSL